MSEETKECAKQQLCEKCKGPLEPEEVEYPEYWDSGNPASGVICGDCEYEDTVYCFICNSSIRRGESGGEIGDVAIAFEELPALARDDLPTGLYRIKKHPFYTCGLGMTLFPDAIERIGPIPEKWADLDNDYPMEWICEDCVKKANKEED